MTEASQPPVVFLDTCVLYPQLLRRLVLGAGRAGLFVPAWSPRVLGEWRLAAARDGGPPAEAAVEAEIQAMRDAFPGAEVEPSETVQDAVRLPDRSDEHVVAGAVAAQAGTILTLNLRDFPVRRLEPFGIAPRHPDGFLWELLSHHPEAMAAVIRRAFEPLDAAGPQAERKALKRAGLGRFGKAWAAMR